MAKQLFGPIVRPVQTQQHIKHEYMEKHIYDDKLLRACVLKPLALHVKHEPPRVYERQVQPNYQSDE